MNVPILGTSRKWNHIWLLCLAYFPKPVFKVHLCCSVCQDSIPSNCSPVLLCSFFFKAPLAAEQRMGCWVQLKGWERHQPGGLRLAGRPTEGVEQGGQGRIPASDNWTQEGHCSRAVRALKDTERATVLWILAFSNYWSPDCQVRLDNYWETSSTA